MKPLHLGASLAVCSVSTTFGQLLLDEEFDGTVGYNPDASTALIGDDDWVDFLNRLADPFGGTEGYATAIGGSETVLTGEPTHNDPQIRTDFALGINKTLVGEVTMRIRADKNLDDQYDGTDTMVAGDVSLFYTFAPFVEPGAQNGPGPNSFGTPTVTAQADGWHLFTWPDPGGITGGATSQPNIEGIRLDPLNNLPGVSYEIDFLRIAETPNPPPQVELDPIDPVGAEFTLRQEWEWTTDGDLDGWSPNAQFDITLPGGVSGGIVTGTSSGGDPFFTSPTFNVPDVTSGRFIVEVGILGEPGDNNDKQIFWALNGGAFNGGQSVTVAAPPGDNALHVYRISFDDDINAPITRLRIDPSTSSGITSRIDFVRIYSEGPEITPPVAALDPAPLGAEWVLTEEWTWDTDDDLEGWTPTNFDVPTPNNGTEGVFGGVLTGTSTTGDPQLQAPSVSITEPASTGVVFEIDFAADPGTTLGGTLFWSVEGSPYGPSTSATLPPVPSDGSPHTVRVTFDNDLGGTITNFRIDPANENGVTVGIDAVRIYRDITGSDYELWSSGQTWPFGTAAVEPSEDFDGDGLSNDDERLFGLDPASPTSVSPIVSTLTPGGTFSYQRRDPALTGATYRIWTSTDLTGWAEDTGIVETPSGGDLQTVSVTLSATPVNGRLFVRVEAE